MRQFNMKIKSSLKWNSRMRIEETSKYVFHAKQFIISVCSRVFTDFPQNSGPFYLSIDKSYIYVL